VPQVETGTVEVDIVQVDTTLVVVDMTLVEVDILVEVGIVVVGITLDRVLPLFSSFSSSVPQAAISFRTTPESHTATTLPVILLQLLSRQCWTYQPPLLAPVS
jgi:hypothetical protein